MRSKEAVRNGGVPRRVAYVVEEFPTVSETFVFNEILEVERRGIEVLVFSLFRPQAPALHETARQFMRRTVYLDELSLGQRLSAWVAALASGRVMTALAAARARSTAQAWYARRCLALAGMLRRAGVDHVHAHFATRATALGLPAARIAGASFTLTAHRYDVFDAPVDGLGAMVNAADACVGVSVELIQELKALHGADSERLHLVPCGVDATVFVPSPAERRAPGNVVTVARLSEAKDLGTAVRAAAVLKRRGVGFRWAAIGEGPQRSALETLIEQESLQAEFQLLGARDSDVVRSTLSSASVFALCSLSEGAPVAIMEAMATATPVVSTNVGGIPQMIEDGVTGFLVSPGRPEALADAIERLVTDPELAHSMGCEARKVAEARFSLTHQVDQLLAVWELGSNRWRGSASQS